MVLSADFLGGMGKWWEGKGLGELGAEYFRVFG